MTDTTTLQPTATGTYAIDPTHSRIGFVARHAMVAKVRGSFNEFEGAGRFDSENPAESTLRLTIRAASIDTRNDDRDAHLRGGDFFDVENHPEITFESTSITPEGGGSYLVTGDLTIRGVAKPVTVEFDYEGSSVDPYDNHRIGFEGRATVNRKDWGITFNAPLDSGGVLISEKITLEFEVSAVRSEAGS